MLAGPNSGPFCQLLSAAKPRDLLACMWLQVAVSSHPGRTKHYQTHYMSPRLMLCDCPGLVFPRLDVALPVQVLGPGSGGMGFRVL